MPYSNELNIAIRAVQDAAVYCIKVQNSLKQETLIKEDRSPVTIADYASQAVICRSLKELFPDDDILAEEHSLDLLEGKNPGVAAALIDLINSQGGPAASLYEICAWINCSPDGNAKRTWILDPIDGTKGFIRGDQYAIALALKVGDDLVLGVLGCPNVAYDSDRLGCLFVAQRQSGARQIYLGDEKIEKPISVSADAAGPNMNFVEGVEAGHTDHSTHSDLCAALGTTLKPVRLDSQAKYAIVARGEASAYLRLQPDLTYRQKIWDHAAGCVLLEEAGGTITDADGKALDFTCGSTLANNNGVVASNGICHSALINTIKTTVT